MMLRYNILIVLFYNILPHWIPKTIDASAFSAAPSSSPNLLVPTIVWAPSGRLQTARPSALQHNQTDHLLAILDEISAAASSTATTTDDNAAAAAAATVFIYTRATLSPGDYRRNWSDLRIPDFLTAPLRQSAAHEVRIMPGVDRPAERLVEWSDSMRSRKPRSVANSIRIRSVHDDGQGIMGDMVSDFFTDYYEAIHSNLSSTSFLLYSANRTAFDSDEYFDTYDYVDASVSNVVLMTFDDFRQITDYGPTKRRKHFKHYTRSSDGSSIDASTAAGSRPGAGPAMAIAETTAYAIDFSIITPIDLNMTFVSDSRYWYVKRFMIGGFRVRPSVEVSSPIGVAYVCPQIYFARIDNAISNPVYAKLYELKNVRLQPNFGEKLPGQLTPSRRVTTCVGFFTVPILMVLMVSGLLVVLLLATIVLVMDVRANDRFEMEK